MNLYLKFKKKVSFSLADETKAAKLYTLMMKMTNNPKIQAILKEIRDDELDHHKKLLNIKDMIR